MYKLDPSIQSRHIHLDAPDFNVHYLETGEAHPRDEVILLLHGWPTSSYLYRHMMVPLAEHHRVIALDLPGFGGSDKNPGDSFSFRYHADILQAFVEQLGITKVHLVVHDLGGPIGLWWAQRHPAQLASYVLLDTIVYPDFSWAVKLFVGMTLMPGVRTWFSSRYGIAFSMKLGLKHKRRLTREALAGYQAPYTGTGYDKAARKALLRSAHRLHVDGFKAIAESLKDIHQPVCLIYADNDVILPEVAQTMHRVAADVPQAAVHRIPDCGHFLQEEKPEAVTAIMANFYNSQSPSSEVRR
ncbi:alpha/beta fold hydrolase [Marinobacter sp. NP-4(2019)]|uniref:alpha/beta fold hydrolase n=1 Tax=Marinobacter sp. NP-4(2019) TaxID=2488665 RepID=UPI000FC3EAA1|nr:alpha/beta fold hydrolase [Marinobacter sp. NP-4(2019)]AZT83629.1 alpha/beta fold hydrolase [Marinobacter sp. NP-4(2019)]